MEAEENIELGMNEGPLGVHVLQLNHANGGAVVDLLAFMFLLNHGMHDMEPPQVVPPLNETTVEQATCSAVERSYNCISQNIYQ